MRKSLIFGLIVLFSCLMTFGYGADQVRVRRKIVTNSDRVRVIEVQTTGEDFYYSVNREALQERLNDELADKVASKTSDKVVDELIRILEEVLAQLGQGENPIPNPNPQPNPEPEPEPDPQPNPGDLSQLDIEAFKIFTSSRYKCNICHNEVKQNGEIQLVNGNTLYNVSALDKFRVYYNVQSGRMPPGTDKLTDEEVVTIGRWANENFTK